MKKINKFSMQEKNQSNIEFADVQLEWEFFNTTKCIRIKLIVGE